MIILGINAYHANASAAIVVEGQLLAAAEEERFNRVKYAAGLPVQAIRYCLAEAGATLAHVDHIAIPRNPRARLATKLRYALRMPRFAIERARVMARFSGIAPQRASAARVAAAIWGGSISKNARRCSRFSLRPKPSVPSECSRPGSHWAS